MINTILDSVIGIVNKFIPDKTQQEAAQAEIMSSMAKVLIEDARSSDLFIRRARPTFLYVMYVLLIIAIPCGIMNMFYPELAHDFITGAADWFCSLPDALYQLLEVCFGVYGVGRSAEKIVKHLKR